MISGAYYGQEAISTICCEQYCLHAQLDLLNTTVLSDVFNYNYMDSANTFEGFGNLLKKKKPDVVREVNRHTRPETNNRHALNCN